MHDSPENVHLHVGMPQEIKEDMNFMQAILDFIGRDMQHGTLELMLGGKKSWRLGHGTPHARIRVRSMRDLMRMLRKPELTFGEVYVDGGWNPVDCSLLQILEVALAIDRDWPKNSLLRGAKIARSLLAEFNTLRESRDNVSHHYDLDASLYRHFLDKDMHYSCAYFHEHGMSLEAAQQAKCAHIAAKLDLRRDAHVLDIGCGWGSMALYLAEHYGAHVTGITLSEEQLSVANERARQRGLEHLVEFHLQDYRQTTGQFDAVVSIGMFEHVGRPQYRKFFNKAYTLTKPDGVILLHNIGRNTPPDAANPWIEKYIFPGGYIPAASEMLAPLEQSGLKLADLEILNGEHYAETLSHWHKRFQSARADIAERLGERFCRMWEFYLQSSEASFRWNDLVVFHAQMTRQTARLPIVRDYLYPDNQVVPKSKLLQLDKRRNMQKTTERSHA